MMEGLYPYCDDCPMEFNSDKEKILCGLHWRPLTGTKCGFPDKNGNNCPKDVLLKLAKTAEVTE